MADLGLEQFKPPNLTYSRLLGRPAAVFSLLVGLCVHSSFARILYRVFFSLHTTNSSSVLIPSTCDMSDPSTPSHFRSFFDAALQDYEKQTGTNLVDHPFAKQLESCDSVESITSFFQEQAQSFGESRGNDSRIMRTLKSAVSILYTLSTSTVLGEAIGLVRRNALMDIPRP